jgi:RHS repeat-associated protein
MDATQYAGTVTVSSGGASPHYFPHTGKRLDEETGLYYYGARYLDPQTSMWLSADPAMGEYVPRAPINDEAKRYNGNLPGMGGVYNYVNLHVYHYAGNNPVKYVDPDGKADIVKIIAGLSFIAGSAGVLVGTVVEDVGTFGVGIINDIPSLAAAGTLFTLRRNLIASGLEDNQQSNNAGQSLTNRAQAVSSAPAPRSPDDDNDNKKANMRKLSEAEIKRRTGTEVHDVKHTIRNQYSAEINESGVSRNFDIYENNGEVIIKGNQGGAELNLKINLESLGVN